MTIKDWWGQALGTFKADEPFRNLSNFQGKRFTVDISIFLNMFLQSDVNKLALMSSPPYPCPDLMQSVMDFHSKISKVIHPVYVFDGVAPNVKDGTKAYRASIQNRDGKFYLDQVLIAKEDSDYVFSSDDISKATFARMKMSHPTSLDHANVLRWMKREGIECYRSLLKRTNT